MRLHRIILAEMFPGLRLSLRFANGAEGIADFAPVVTQGPALAWIAAAPAALIVMQGGQAVAWPNADRRGA